MFSQQITCLYGQCDVPSCGPDYVYIGSQHVGAEAIINNLETGAGSYWTLVVGRPVAVVVGVDHCSGKSVVTTPPRRPI